MQKNRKWLIAVALGLAAGVLHLIYVNGLENEQRGGADVEVLAAAKRIAAGEKIEMRDLAERKVPAAFVDSRVVRRGQIEEVIGLAAAVDIESGETIQWTDFSHRKATGPQDLAERVEAGQRAITIPVDRTLSMGGMLRPGHRVDILSTVAKGGGIVSKDKLTVTLLQNVLVLATGRETNGDNPESETSRFDTVTLSVGLEEAELLSLAATLGRLSLVLRGHQDLSLVRDVPEKGVADIYEAERRNAVQLKKSSKGAVGIERLAPR